MTRVLLIEGDPARRDRFALALRKARFELRSAADAEGGLRLLPEAQPDVLVVGATAPGIDFREACAAARSADGGRALSVIALLPESARTARAVREAILDGADDALPFDCDPADLVEAIRARERRAPAAGPTLAEDVPSFAVMESASHAMPRPLWIVSLEIEDADAVASVEGFEALRELSELWRGRIRALIPEQAAFFPAGRSTATVFLPGSTPEPRALLAALGGTGQPVVRVGGRELRLRSSIGVLQVGDGERLPPIEIALARSRHALAVARLGPQPRLHVHSAGDAERTLSEAHLATLLQHALERGDFRLVYQPIVSIASGETIAAEALIRWNLPTTGEPIPATRLLAVAEDAGLLAEIGSWALREACRQCAAWSRAGVELPVSVNVAPSQFRRGDLEDEVRLALSEAAIPGRLLTLELKEGLLERDGEAMLPQLEGIRVAGARIAIDDFGTGIAGVGLLHRYPVDELKVDRTVVARLPGSAEDRATLESALRHARGRGIACTAEGVEQPAQWAFLAERGWHAAQGWLVAHPLGGSDIPGFVQRDPAVRAAAAGAQGA